MRRGTCLLALASVMLAPAALSVGVAGATGAGGRRGSRAAGAPVIRDGSASNVTETGATLQALINPKGSETKYEFVLVRSGCPQGVRSCPPGQTRVVGTGSLPAGTTDAAVSAAATGLTSGTAYRFWVLASNSSGQSQGKGKRFTTAG